MLNNILGDASGYFFAIFHNNEIIAVLRGKFDIEENEKYKDKY
jgi:hypothetical protein